MENNVLKLRAKRDRAMIVEMRRLAQMGAPSPPWANRVLSGMMSRFSREYRGYPPSSEIYGKWATRPRDPRGSY